MRKTLARTCTGTPARPGCGRQYEGASQSRRCPDCRKKDRHVNTGARRRDRHSGRSHVTYETLRCAVCGQEYSGNPSRARYCPDCRTHVSTDRARHAGALFAGVDSEGVTGGCEIRGCGCDQYTPTAGDDGPCQCGHRKSACRADGAWEPGHRHVTVLWQCGEYQLADPDGISTGRALAFLYDCSRRYPQHTAFVGFSLGYDFDMLLRGMPRERAEKLLTRGGIEARRKIAQDRARRGALRTGGDPGAAVARSGRIPVPVDYRARDTGQEWQLDMLPGRRLRFRPAGGRERVTRKPGDAGYMYVCDAFSFYQSSFLKAIDPAQYPAGQGPCTQEEYENIKRGKDRRGVHRLDDDMRRYCALEVKTLERLMTLLAQAVTTHLVIGGKPVKLRKTQWFGPGQVVQAVLTLLHCPTRDEVEQAVRASPCGELVLEAAREGYFGGWFEIPVHGHVGTVHEYDINSAYPDVIRDLPCLLHGKWTRGKPGNRASSGVLPVLREGQVRLVQATVHGSDEYLGAMLHRTPAGHNVRPHHTGGWYWQHELDAARHAGLVDTVEADQWLTYTPCACPPPLAEFEDLYQARMNLADVPGPDGKMIEGKDTISGKVLKTTYSSGYGKLAQSVGDPKFTNFVWASLVTAGCRVRILDAIATHPVGSRAVVMIATDGVYFTSPHPGLPRSKELGDWGYKEHRDMTLVKPGFYYDAESRTQVAAGKPVALKARGVNAKAVAPQLSSLDVAWRDWEPGVAWPGMRFTDGFAVVSCVQALAWGRWDLAGLVCEDNPRGVSSDPTFKRQACTLCRFPGDHGHVHNTDAVHDDGGMWRSRPYGVGHDAGTDTLGRSIVAVSTGYNPEFMAQASEHPVGLRRVLNGGAPGPQDMSGPDGDLMKLIAESVGVG